MNSKYFLIYLTANDSKTYHADIQNFLDMAKYDPGVGMIDLYLVISVVRKFTLFDRLIFNLILRSTGKCKWLNIQKIILKENKGRDFSSAEAGLKEISKEAEEDDFILIRNRSSIGPFHNNWYKTYITQFEANPGTGLVGSTINLNDHYTRNKLHNVAHVQTYIYFSQWRYFLTLLMDFPGHKVFKHDDAILFGEIELSQRLLSQGLKISSLQKPSMVIDLSNQNHKEQFDNIPFIDFKDLPIIHKKRRLKKINMWMLLKMYVRLLTKVINKNNRYSTLDLRTSS